MPIRKEQIAAELKQLREEIQLEEQKTNQNSLLKKYHLYDAANDVCTAAEELPKNPHMPKNTADGDFYKCLLTLLQKTKTTVKLPSLENATDLLNYQNSICYTEQTCNSPRHNQLWGAIKVLTGAVLCVAALVTMFVLPPLVPLSSGAIFGIYMALIIPGITLYKLGTKQINDGKNKLDQLKHHAHLSGPEVKIMQPFLSKMSIFTNKAETIGSIAEKDYQEKEALKKADALNTLIRASA